MSTVQTPFVTAQYSYSILHHTFRILACYSRPPSVPLRQHRSSKKHRPLAELLAGREPEVVSGDEQAWPPLAQGRHRCAIPRRIAAIEGLCVDIQKFQGWQSAQGRQQRTPVHLWWLRWPCGCWPRPSRLCRGRQLCRGGFGLCTSRHLSHRWLSCLLRRCLQHEKQC